MPDHDQQRIRISVCSREQADQVWQMLIRQTMITEAEVHLDGVGFLFTAVRSADASWSVLRKAPVAHTAHPAVPAAAPPAR